VLEDLWWLASVSERQLSALASATVSALQLHSPTFAMAMVIELLIFVVL
jgi:hypothetical protein